MSGGLFETEDDEGVIESPIGSLFGDGEPADIDNDHGGLFANGEVGDAIASFEVAAEAAKDAALVAQTAAETAETNAETAETNAATSATAAAGSATSAAASATTATTQASTATTKASEAATSASTATTQAGTATTKAGEAATSATSAAASATSATSSSTTATTKASEASASATTAATQATNAASSATGAASSASTASTHKTAAETAKTAAETAKTAAETAETNAETAETNAETAETNAETAETNAASSATSASTSATNAAASATSASGSASTATTQASTATTKASEASTSATNAASSATAAGNSASTANTHKTAAETAKTAAETAKTAAETAKTAAETAETNAETAETNAETAETNAAASSSSASTSATNAAASATSASGSASTATTQASTATTKASEASTSATNAASSATAAANSATAAASSATSASSSATTATTQASTATTKANTATTKASEASTSAASALSAKTAAESARDSALSAFDNFDDKYLGAKSSDPTVDNDGDALVSGALYFNTNDDVMMVYTGSTWVAAYASLSGALLVSNNLSDVNSAGTAATNIGLGTGSSPTFAGATINGNISVTGTVDGRDVATDGTKLDGVEANATADQTAAEIRALVESATDSNVFTDNDHTKLNSIESNATADQTAGEIEAIVNHDNLQGFVAAEHIDWSTDQGSTNIHTGNYVNTTYSVGDGGLTQKNFTTALNTKLDGVEAGATADQTDAEIRTAVEAAIDSNVFTDADHSKLNAIEASATADQTDAEIRAAVEAATDSNVFTDADHTKLNAIEALADVTDTANVVAALTAGTNVTIAANGTISATDTDTTYTSSDFNHDALQGFVANEHIDWTADQGATNIHSGNYINTTYSVGDGGLTQKNFTTTLKTKLDGIEAGATADQTDAEIRTAVEAATDSNVFTDADHSKLNAIEASADVTDTANVVAALTAGTNVSIANDGTISATDTNTTYTSSSFNHDDLTGFVANEHIDWTSDQGSTNLHAGNYTNTTYSVGDGGLTQNNFTNTLKSKLDGIEASATADQTASEIRTLVESATDSNVFTDADHSKLNAIEANATADQTASEIEAVVNHDNLQGFVTAEHIDWSADQGATNIHSGNYTNTTYSVGDGGLTQNNFTNTLKSKLDGVETSATADQTDAQIRAAVEAATDSNVFTDADHSKLNAIEANATADQTDAEIRAAVEAATDSNVFTDADHTKLNAIEASADVTDTANVVAALTAGTNVSIAANGTISSTDTNTTYSVGDGGLTTNDFTNTLKLKLDGIEASATADQTASEIEAIVSHDNLAGFVSNEHIDWTASGAGSIHLTNLPATALTAVQTASSESAMLALTTQEGDVVVRSDENKTYMHNSGSAGTMADFTLLATPTDAVTSVDGATGAVTLNHDALTGFVANEHIDWTTDQGATNLHAGNYVNTTYAVGDGGLTQKNFTTTLKTKLDGIETAATADQTAAEIRALVESAADSNVFTDADHTKLNGIEASADATDTSNVTSAGALMDSEVTNLAQVKAFSSSDYATAAQGATADAAMPTSGGTFTGDISFEGATANDYETTVTVTDPTADRTITLPNATGTVLLADGDGSNLTGVQAASVDVDESSDDDVEYNILFSDTSGTGNIQMTPVQDDNGFTFNPSTNAITIRKIKGGSTFGNTYIESPIVTGTLEVYGDITHSGDSDTKHTFGTDTQSLISGGATGLTVTSSGASAPNGLDVTGNITVSGTVDGVDIAARDGVLTSTTTTANAAMPTTGGTFSGDVTFADNEYAKFGNGADLWIGHIDIPFQDEYNGISAHSYDLILTNITDDRDVIIRTDDGSGNFTEYFRADGSTGEVQLYHYGNERLATRSYGGKLGGDTWYLGGNSPSSGQNTFIVSERLDIKHGGYAGHGEIDNNQGNFTISNTSNNYDVSIKTDDGIGGTTDYFKADGSTGEAILYHYGSEKLASKSTGVDISGYADVDNGIRHNGNLTNEILFGANTQTFKTFGQDRIHITNTGVSIYPSLYANGDIVLTDSNSKITRPASGAIGFTAAGSERARVNSSGLDVTGNITVSGTVDGVDIASRDAVLTSTTTTANAAMPKSGGVFTDNVSFGDGDEIQFGDGFDLKLLHIGSNSYITNYTGSLYIRSVAGSHIKIQALSGEESIVAAANGSVDLYYDNSKKFETTNTGISVTGTLAATAVTGDGSGLTNLPASSDSTKMPLSGGTFSGDVTFNDNVYAKFGNATGGDVKIGHNGNGLINNYTNDLYIQNYANDRDVIITSDNGSGGTLVYFTADGSTGETKLYHYGYQKLASKSTGISVSGSIDLSGAITEDVYVVNLGSGTHQIDPASDGGIFYMALLASCTLGTSNLLNGQSQVLMIDDGSGYTLTWPTMTWINNAGSAPTLSTTARTTVVVWKANNIVYGALVGDGT
jgi:hypothetical protein